MPTSLLQLILQKLTLGGPGDTITALRLRDVENAIANTIQKTVPYGTSIPFDSSITVMTGKKLITPDVILPNGVGAVEGFGCTLWLRGDGTHSPDLSGWIVTGGFNNTNDVLNLLVFYYDGTNYYAYVSQPGTSSAGSGGSSSQLASPAVSFGATTSTTVAVNWTAVTGATNYIVKRNTTNSLTGATQIYSGSGTSFADTGLTAATTYYYFVIAQGAGLTDSVPGTGSKQTSASGSGYQAESDAFFSRAETAEGAALPTTFKNAYDAMIVSLKSASVYSKLRAMYVYPGATAAAHALNAISASFGLTFVGAVTHGAGGVTWGGGYADTGLTPSTSGMVDYSGSFGFVDRTSTPHGTVDVFEMGVGDGTESWYVYTSYGSPASAYGKIGGQQMSLASSTDASGFWLVTQTTNSSQAFYRNGTLNQANSNGNFDTQPTRSVYLMAMNSSGTATTPSQHNVPFHFIGDGLSATDVTNLNNAVSTFLTAIGR